MKHVNGQLILNLVFVLLKIGQLKSVLIDIYEMWDIYQHMRQKDDIFAAFSVCMIICFT